MVCSSFISELFCSDTIGCLNPEIVDWSSVARVICNSGKCNQSGYMHAECFTKYEDALVNFMSKQGRGRTWNDKQVRLEDLGISYLILMVSF